jgi:hypothetical protein
MPERILLNEAIQACGVGVPIARLRGRHFTFSQTTVETLIRPSPGAGAGRVV